MHWGFKWRGNEGKIWGNSEFFGGLFGLYVIMDYFCDVILMKNLLI